MQEVKQLDNETKQKLSEIDKDITELKENDKEQADRLRSLEIKFESQSKTLEYVKINTDKIEEGMKEIKGINLQNQNTLLEMLISNNENNTKKEISKFDNLTKITIQVLAIVGTVLTTVYFSSKLITG